jgi:hypothetical protein
MFILPLISILMLFAHGVVEDDASIFDMFPADDYFASPNAYGLPSTDYSTEIPPLTVMTESK